jgi:DNA polymerase III subunit chi
MTEVLFYHLADLRLEDVLPGLVEKSVERGWRAVVQCGTEATRDALDELLWAWSETSFIGHATDEAAQLAGQPVILTTSSHNPNGSTVRFIVDRAVPPDVSAYQRAVLIFDGHDEGQIEDARASWKQMKAAGHDVTYWQQNEMRKWERRG